MRFQSVPTILAALAAATTASAQSVVGTAYGFATGVTGGGDASAAAPSSAEELAEWLADDTPRTILIDREYDFRGTTETGAGCDRKSCSASDGGQLYLGDLSCGGEDNVAVSSVEYDAAGTEPLKVGSNKSIIGVGGSDGGGAVIAGKGLSFQDGASNVIVQGLELVDINPGVVWGGDALDFQGNNDGVWVDHCRVSLVGRMFAVTHYDGSRLTLSNNEFDGATDASASCNGNHYWTMMFYGDGDRVTLDRNYFHDVSGRAPKLGEPGVSGTFQASNNYFSDMKGHAFDAYEGASAIIEGNAFEAVDQPITSEGAEIATVFNVPDEEAAAACESHIGRACVVNSVDSASGDWPSLSDESGLQAFSDLSEYLVEPLDAAEVPTLVAGNAGPANLGSGEAAQRSPVVESEETEALEETIVETPVAESEAPEPIFETPAEDEEVEDVAEDEDVTEEEEVVDEDEEDEDEDEYDYEENCGDETADEEPTTELPAPEESETPSAEKVQQYGQCGGANWTGSTACVDGTSCVEQNDFYSQCLSSAERRKKRSLRSM